MTTPTSTAGTGAPTPGSSTPRPSAGPTGERRRPRSGSTQRTSTCPSARTRRVPGLGTVQDEDVVPQQRRHLVGVLRRHRPRPDLRQPRRRRLLARLAGLRLRRRLRAAADDLYFSTAGNTFPPGVSGGVVDLLASAFRHLPVGRSRVRAGSAMPSRLAPHAGEPPTSTASSGSTRPTSTCPSTETVILPGTRGTVADEDVVYYNAGTWSLYFDGSAHGLGGHRPRRDQRRRRARSTSRPTTPRCPPGVGGTR